MDSSPSNFGSAEELTLIPAWNLREHLQSHALSPVDLVKACLDSIDRLEPSIHAFITVLADEALADAAAMERAIMKGNTSGLLQGIPVVLKDDLWVKGTRCTVGSLLLQDFRPLEDSTVATKLRAAGAIILGKTNMPEFASFFRSVSRLAPDCRNPWDLSRTSGGSSGGSAASVAAGMAPLGIGTDGGGSIRLPSALCGIVGLLPTRGLVSNYGSVTAGQGFAGPMARNVRDVATLLQVIAGGDERDRWAYPSKPQDYLAQIDGGVRGMRMAWSSSLGHVEARDARVINSARSTAQVLEGLGASVEETSDANIGDVQAAWFVIRDGASAHDDGPVLFRDTPEYAALLEESGRDKLCSYLTRAGRSQRSAEISAMTYEDAVRIRRRTAVKLNALFEQYDVFLTPTFGEIAPRITDAWEWPFPARFYSGYTNFANLCGLPAISIPAAHIDGLPTGLQVIGRAGSEATLLRVARALEGAQPWPSPHVAVGG